MQYRVAGGEPGALSQARHDRGRFVPIGLIAVNPNALSNNPCLPTLNVREFIALVKARPGTVNYGSAGVGASPQLSMELFKLQAGIDIVHVPYRSIGTATVDLIAGQIQAMFSTVPSVLGPARSGKLRVLGVSSLTRPPDLPDVPTIDQSGMPGFEVVSWQGLCNLPGCRKTRSSGFARPWVPHSRLVAKTGLRSNCHRISEADIGSRTDPTVR